MKVYSSRGRREKPASFCGEVSNASGLALFLLKEAHATSMGVVLHKTFPWPSFSCLNLSAADRDATGDNYRRTSVITALLSQRWRHPPIMCLARSCRLTAVCNVGANYWYLFLAVATGRVVSLSVSRFLSFFLLFPPTHTFLNFRKNVRERNNLPN